VNIQDPYKDIEFEIKNVKITDQNNKIIFENQIEFPKDFDDNAAAIVASRYLCNDAKNKETSLKQMFDRVSTTITTWGLDLGYFDNKKDDLNELDEFCNKLKFYQMHRYFAFNSPVYFNVGLQELPQTSACFILGVEDNMDSITELGKLEAQIFKKGSGAGSNLSTLRSSKEPVKGGGNASGPISFLKAHDTLAGVVKSGGTLRRSAKLACLNIDHPDIEEFIDCKLFEEEKLAALRKAGIKNRPGYDLADEVYFQNTNLSVRVNDNFMDRVVKNKSWETISIKDGKIYKKYQARDLLRKIAEVSHKIADPGIQFDDTFNRWNTLANDEQIVATNPCGEFASLNNTSCNLASLNLMKFFSKNENNTIIFDGQTFEDVIKTVITAQDILIDKSNYPSLDIGLRTAAYRNLGLGYTNLGGLLMWLGLPYDCNEGRLIAAALTALMTGIAYKTSADLADKIGPFIKFEDNKSSFKNVIKLHHDAIKKLILENPTSLSPNFANIINSCLSTWDKVSNRTKFRNAQVSLLAPTGTISSLMNAVTTGIEPEYSLIRYKRLAGSDGATLKYVNPIVEESLRNLGYSETEIPELVRELIEPCGEIATKFKNSYHRNIFLTAATSPGSNLCIPYMGHVKMCAAVQPFLSGAISKTINLPKECTVDEIYTLYIEAWKMGLKGITVYRDGSKNFQPLSTQDNKETKEKEIVPTKLTRKKMPDERFAITHKFRIGSSEGYLTCGIYPDSNKLGEIFVNVSKEGSALSGFADALATVLSISLQYGVPLKDFVRKLSHLKFEPNGFTTNPDIRIAHSIVDYIVRYVGLKFLPKEEQIELGLIQANDTNGMLLEKEESNIQPQTEIVGPSCPNCGNTMRRLGSCYFCGNCSYNQGSCG
jgi:ribonucleoside-diphosphate reductase alpha chain